MPLPEPKWDDRGLVPAVVQDADRGTVLMLAWMNHHAWRLTNETGTVHFWSRSRQALWKKGETSGHVLRVGAHADLAFDRVGMFSVGHADSVVSARARMQLRQRLQ